MTLEEFIQEQHNILTRFQTYWKERNESEPNIFASEMRAGDWDEQLASFASEYEDNMEEVKE